MERDEEKIVQEKDGKRWRENGCKRRMEKMKRKWMQEKDGKR